MALDTFFCNERKSEEKREAGVGFAIKTEIVGKLSGLPKVINDRLMTLRLPLLGIKHAERNNVQSRCYHPPLYPNPTSHVLTRVLPLGAVG